MVGADIDEFPIMMDKKEAVAEIKRNLKDKWKTEFDLLDKAGRVQEVFTDVEKDIVLEMNTGIIPLC